MIFHKITEKICKIMIVDFQVSVISCDLLYIALYVFICTFYMCSKSKFTRKNK